MPALISIFYERMGENVTRFPRRRVRPGVWIAAGAVFLWTYYNVF